MTQHSYSAKRRIAAFAVFPVAGALLLAGCSTPAEDVASDEPVTIVLGIQTQTNQNLPYTTMVDKFMDENPNITVEIVETPNADFGSVIKTQFQGGSAPDVIYGSPGSGNANSLLPYAAAGYLLPLTDETWAVDAVPESADTLYYADDQLWALPTDVAPITWAVNQDVFDTLGLDYATDLSEVIDQCAAARDAGLPLIQLAGSLVPNAGIFTLQVAASRVYSQEPDWNQQRADGNVTFADSDGWKDTLQTVVDMKDAGCFQDGAEGGTFDDLFSSVAQGLAATMFAPAGVVADLGALNPDGNFTVIPFPGDKAADTFLFASPSNALGVNAATEHPEASLKLLEFFATPENQDAMAELTGNASLASVLAGAAVPDRFSNIESLLTDPTKNAPLANLFWPNGEVYNQLGIGVQGLLTGQATVDAVLASMDDAWDNN